MPSALVDEISKATVNLSDWEIRLDGPLAEQPKALLDKVGSLIAGGPGFAIAYGTKEVLSRHELDISTHQNRAYELIESVFRGAMARVDFKRYAVIDQPMALAHMDVDGFNLNGNFSHDGKIQSRAFMTSKCIHFDAATPFIANTYGLNENIEGGYPLLCDVRSYCRDYGISPADIVDAIPNNYNVAIRREHYSLLKDDYSAGIDIDVDTDIIAVMLLNEIADGVAHGATTPFKRDETKPARRPIRHFEYQFGDEKDYVDWYGYYGVPMVQAGNYAGENLSLDYYEPASQPFDRLVKVGA